ncbi:hypothetical protein RFI_19193 [Reticulomyxa filosa]|uniref:Uncharacterized protein n=1 Tax=Reticulomyxa filosa TaxID=46433 RepID=X6MWS5_RETFI|nr:hypothetical protein RFI_19193 [Reticulomyxa filosa]|eukprot:ETO18096.1 hypothetical protein RFI_19193 [Reticulomyxa filosa]
MANLSYVSVDLDNTKLYFGEYVNHYQMHPLTFIQIYNYIHIYIYIYMFKFKCIKLSWLLLLAQPKGVNDETNVTISTKLSSLTSEWKFDVSSVGLPTATGGISNIVTDCVGVVDFASPYIGVSMSSNQYTGFWNSLSSSSCNQTTLQCPNVDNVVSFIQFKIQNTTFQLNRDNFVKDSSFVFCLYVHNNITYIHK